MALWNRRDIIPPTMMNGMVESKNIKPQISTLITTTTKMLEDFSCLKRFEKAAAFLSRFCHLYKLRMRNMHGFQLMRRLNQTLIRIKCVNISFDILNVHGFLPDSSYIGKEVNLPVRSNLEYLLVRLQGLGKLLLRVVYLTEAITRYQLKQISDGFLYFQISIFISLMGELWVLARDVCRRLEVFYDELYTTLVILPESGECWLAKDYHLPTNLAEWLGDQFKKTVRCADKGAVLDMGDNSNMFTLLKHRETDGDAFMTLMDFIVAKAKNEPKPVETSINRIPKTMLLASLRSDTGELVTRTPTGTKKKKAAFGLAKLNNIRSKFQVENFIAEERAKRKKNSKHTVTSQISNAQFEDFNVRLMNQFHQSSANFVNYFKKEFVKLVCPKNKK